MPAARESLLDAAYTALARRSWSTVRMVDVAAAAGVSRQTLYNEFGSKEGLRGRWSEGRPTAISSVSSGRSGATAVPASG